MPKPIGRCTPHSAVAASASRFGVRAVSSSVFPPACRGRPPTPSMTRRTIFFPLFVESSFSVSSILFLLCRVRAVTAAVLGGFLFQLVQRRLGFFLFHRVSQLVLFSRHHPQLGKEEVRVHELHARHAQPRQLLLEYY